MERISLEESSNLEMPADHKVYTTNKIKDYTMYRSYGLIHNMAQLVI